MFRATEENVEKCDLLLFVVVIVKETDQQYSIEMSGRQSLYGQSLLRNASSVNLIESHEKHWKRDWYTPSKSVVPSSTVTPSGTPTPFGEERELTQSSNVQKLPFSVKTWVLNTEYQPVIDGIDSDILDFNSFNVVKSKKSSSGLTDDAIRGAVGSESVLAGLSKSVDSATQRAVGAIEVKEEKEEVQTPSTLATSNATPTPAPAPAEEATSPTTATETTTDQHEEQEPTVTVGNQDADGDVVM